jgi:hypothetical protein
MRKVLAMVFTIALFGVFAGSSTVAVGSACPDQSKNPGGTPPNCGHPGGGNSGGGGGGGNSCGKGHNPHCQPPPGAPACGPASSGGSAATGPVSGPVYGLGTALSGGGAPTPLADAVQEIACALDTNLGL